MPKQKRKKKPAPKKPAKKKKKKPAPAKSKKQKSVSRASKKKKKSVSKASKKKKKPTQLVEVVLPIPDDVNPKEVAGLAYLRNAAGNFYVYHPEGVSVGFMAKHELYGRVPKIALERWCLMDKWVERRRDWAENLRKKIEAKMGTEMIQLRMKNLDHLVALQTSVFNEVIEKMEDADGNTVMKLKMKPKSLESTLQVLLKFEQRIDELRDQMAEFILPKTRGVLPRTTDSKTMHSNLKPVLSQDDIRATAKFLIQRRRESMRNAVSGNEASEIPENPEPEAEVADNGEG